jgi:DNA-binding LytR/AlgR family response regulator
MSETDKTPSKKSEMTAADAAKQVRRTVVEPVLDDDGKPTGKTKTKTLSVKVDEVLSFKDYGSHVVVVTTDGQKLSSLQGE